jgi:hypothetical protein
VAHELVVVVELVGLDPDDRAVVGDAIDSVLEGRSDLGSSEPEAQPVSPEIQLTMKSTHPRRWLMPATAKANTHGPT